MERGRSAPCVHRWILGEPNRGSIQGICRRCGSHRTYPAGLELPETVLAATPEEEQEAEPVLELPALAAAVSSLKEHALV